jgi:hypothetical protein
MLKIGPIDCELVVRIELALESETCSPGVRRRASNTYILWKTAGKFISHDGESPLGSAVKMTHYLSSNWWISGPHKSVE